MRFLGALLFGSDTKRGIISTHPCRAKQILRFLASFLKRNLCSQSPLPNATQPPNLATASSRPRPSCRLPCRPFGNRGERS